MKKKTHPTKHASIRISGAARVTTARVPMTWRWHFRVLQTLRDQLLDEKAVGLDAGADPIEPHSMDPADSATDEFDRALAVRLLSGEQDALYEVEAAIQRILNGTYGVCEMTEERIPAKRLRAVPWTRLTRGAQDSVERVGLSRSIHLAGAESIQGAVAASLAQAGEPESGELQARVVARHRLAESLRGLQGSGSIAESPPTLGQGKSLGTFSRQSARPAGSRARNAKPSRRRRGMR
ncbi:MAG: TraR/DksA C4-type zinc finger protein [Chthoniobacteraceae bacterium]